jgi:hypothetical protein
MKPASPGPVTGLLERERAYRRTLSTSNAVTARVAVDAVATLAGRQLR